MRAGRLRPHRTGRRRRAPAHDQDQRYDRHRLRAAFALRAARRGRSCRPTGVDAHLFLGRAVGPLRNRAAGPLTVYAVPDNPAAGVEAAVHETVTGNGTTIVTLHLSGFGPSAEGRTFGAHAHVNPCGSVGTDAGPHYTHPVAAPTLEERE